MEITIEGPAFYALEDEDLFFSCIYELPGYQNVRGQGLDLHISFADPLSGEAIIRLLVIFRRWGVDIAPLEKFKQREQPENPLWRRALL